jgi:hypothetical protein
MNIKVQGGWKGAVTVADGASVLDVRAAVAAAAGVHLAAVKLLCGGK